jgi:two-component system chemotaxis response regulator CheB
LQATNARTGQRLLASHVYVALPDCHLLVEPGRLRVTKGPKENRFRPAVDPLFRSAAYIYGPRTIGIVLTGALDDGTAGLWAIKLRGGTAIVQDPSDAQHRSMPLNALDNVEVDYKASAAEMGPLLGRLVREEALEEQPIAELDLEKMQAEVKIAEGHDAMDSDVRRFGELSAFTCPECHGVLTLLRDGKIKRFRCHTGHAFSSDALLESATEQVEDRLWDAVRILDETVLLLNQLGEEFAKAGDTKAAEFCFAKARDAYERAQPVREAAMANETLTADEAAGTEVPEKPARAGRA